MKKSDNQFPLFVTAILFLLLLNFSCNNEYMPKPKAYHRIVFPEKSYELYSNPGCPFQFEFPGYAKVVWDSTFFNESQKNPCWLNVDFQELNGKIHISYAELAEKEDLAKRIEDAHTLTFKHTKKADFIDESKISNQYGVKGMLYEVGGDAASSVQFYVSDDSKHFLRGSLYFETSPNIDSMGIVVDFVKVDMLHLLSTFQWK